MKTKNNYHGAIVVLNRGRHSSPIVYRIAREFNQRNSCSTCELDPQPRVFHLYRFVHLPDDSGLESPEADDVFLCHAHFEEHKSVAQFFNPNFSSMDDTYWPQVGS